MFLVVVGQRGKTTTLSSVVRKATFKVGRDPDNDLVLKHPSVSRRHCRVFCVNENAAVEDIGSTNGTFVNGRQLKRSIMIDSSDELQVGEYVLRVRSLFGDDNRVHFDSSPPESRTIGGSRGGRPRKGPGESQAPPSSVGGRSKVAEKKAFELLGIVPTTPMEAGKRAYKKLVIPYHPDRVAGAAEEIRELAERRTKEINGAWALVEPRLPRR